MDIMTQIWELSKQRKSDIKDAENKFKDLSKKRLIQILRKKFQTCFIGSINEIEKNFGYLWGYGKDPKNLNANELEWKQKWEQIRNKLLNSGNNQIRGMEAELDRNEVAWKRYHTELLTQEGKERRENDV